ncbi:hypothetical protein [Novosphingobium album (ex Hu et al. 2023)]|uniref:N-acetyltransferase n=1 Tax=Novosphingobium album (ex Hu et al. 2023) TaxID=2930093 RepID=A0ABT0B6C4_9SPHN|nr:hypothetical protein [Novosphingobium album (ex Hu et al. 2023)]MCJ2180620.1 hypothetical protein [Novosphingobium album (ex Hu et al. 2023)]
MDLSEENRFVRGDDWQIRMLRIQIASSRRDIREFIDLPSQIYSKFDTFVAPLRMDRGLMLDPKQSAAWKRSRIRYWIARIDGQSVGRISAQIDETIPIGVASGSGMFGCLDAIDDERVVASLMEAARQWLEEQGCTYMYGPCSLNMNEEPGLLVEGANEPAMTLCPWHPPYLGEHLDHLGFSRVRDLHNWRLDLDQGPPAIRQGHSALSKRIPNLTVRHPSRATYAADIQILCDIYNDGWRDNWGFIPLAPADLAGLDQLMKWLVPREAFKIVELDGVPVAATLLIPNLFELTRGIPPTPGPLQWLKILWRACNHRFQSGRIIITGVAYRLRGTLVGSAIASLLVDELIASHQALKGHWVEAGWVLENNHALIQILERFNFRRSKTFRIYGKDTAPAPTTL